MITGAGRIASVAGLALAGVVLSSSGAAAATYCKLTRLPHFPGQDGTVQMTAVVETVPRVSEIPGRRVGNWCWLGVGSATFPYPYAKATEILAKPARGEVRTHTYGVWFKSKAAGQDAFTFRVHQYNPADNAPVATTYRVDVNVVGAAF
jgi:hypothetical protein